MGRGLLIDFFVKIVIPRPTREPEYGLKFSKDIYKGKIIKKNLPLQNCNATICEITLQALLDSVNSLKLLKP